MAPPRVAVQKLPWVRLLIPGQPAEVPKADAAALRLTLASLEKGAEGAAGPEATEAEVQISVPGRCSNVTLARLTGGAVRLRALIGCGDGASLTAVGGPVLLSGRLEGVLPAEWLKAAVKKESPTDNRKRKAPPPQKPKTEEEYMDWVDKYLREHGSTSLRKLGNDVPRPRKVKPGMLKQTLNRYRWKFVLDLQGKVDVNHRKWRWRWRPPLGLGRRWFRRSTTIGRFGVKGGGKSKSDGPSAKGKQKGGMKGGKGDKGWRSK